MTSKLTPSWTNDPNTHPKESLCLVDIIGVAGFDTPGNTNNSVTLTLGVAATGETYTQDAVLYSPPGLLSMPVAAGTYDVNGNFTPANASIAGSQAVAFFRDDQWIVLGTRDTRSQLQAGSLGSGETCLYAQEGQARVLLKTDGTINLVSTSDNTATGTNIQASFGPNGFYVFTPFGKLSLDASGFRVSIASGASFALMNTSDPTTGNAIMMSAGSCTVNSGLITLGTPENGSLPAVYGVLPVAAPGIPILGEGVGLVTVNAAASTSVYIGI